MAEHSIQNSGIVRKAPLSWLVGGIILGLVQVAAIAVHQPLGVSTQFVVADTQVLEAAAPQYVASHALIKDEKYRQLGYPTCRGSSIRFRYVG